MPYMLDKWQYISGINMRVLNADYAVCYARFDPPYAVMAGYATVDDPWLRVQENGVETTSVGDWDIGPSPSGSGKRSMPVNFEDQVATPLPTKLPKISELEGVYIWHLGRTHAYALTDQIIVNIKKLREDYPDRSDFLVHLAATTAHGPREGGDGDAVERDFTVPSPRPPLRVIVGLRSYSTAKGHGSEFVFADAELIDPFGNAIKEEWKNEVAHLEGAEISANFERFAPTATVTVYNNINIYQTRGFSWRIDWKRPKYSRLGAGPIQVQQG